MIQTAALQKQKHQHSDPSMIAHPSATSYELGGRSVHTIWMESMNEPCFAATAISIGPNMIWLGSGPWANLHWLCKHWGKYIAFFQCTLIVQCWSSHEGLLNNSCTIKWLPEPWPWLWTWEWWFFAGLNYKSQHSSHFWSNSNELKSIPQFERAHILKLESRSSQTSRNSARKNMSQMSRSREIGYHFFM